MQLAHTCKSCRYIYLYLVLSADVCENLLVMQALHLYLVLSADVCANPPVIQVFIPGVISRCLRKPASHAGVYIWCYQQMSAKIC